MDCTVTRWESSIGEYHQYLGLKKVVRFKENIGEVKEAHFEPQESRFFVRTSSNVVAALHAVTGNLGEE